LSFKSPLPRLELYVLRESVLPFFLGFGLVTFLFVIDFLFDYLDLILAKGVPFFAVLELFVLALGWITVLSFPCGVLVAALMTFGRLAQDNEITAMRSLGVNVGRVLRGPLLAGLALGALLAAYNNYVLPETNHRFANLSLAIHRKRPAAKIEPGIFINAFENYSLLARKVDDRTGDMQDITIYDYNQGTVPTTILAQRGKMQYIDRGATLKLDLWDGEIHEVPGQAGDNRYRRGRFEQNTIYLHNPGALLQKVDRKSRGDREMTVGMMREEIARLRDQQSTRLASVDEKARAAGFPSYRAIARYVRPPTGTERVRMAVTGLLGADPPALADTVGLSRTVQDLELDVKEVENLERRVGSFRVEIQKKFSIPFACVVFVLVGGPLGIRTRKGGFANMAFAVAFFIVYYLCLIAGEQLADRRLLSPVLAMWFPNILFGAVGTYLTFSVVGWGPSRGMR
jgi:lipopolysaccharide export system permease protein